MRGWEESRPAICKNLKLNIFEKLNLRRFKSEVQQGSIDGMAE